MDWKNFVKDNYQVRRRNQLSSIFGYLVPSSESSIYKKEIIKGGRINE